MLTLAQAAQSPALGAKFLSVYHQIVQEEADLQTAARAAANTLGGAKDRTLTAA